jgi:glycosyltransferase involved in cell wall biosynthesis
MSGEQPWHICILIPARNEEALLSRCLQSVIASKLTVENSATTDIIVAADSSTDKTPQIAASFLEAQGSVLSINAGNVGAARRLAARLALKRYSGPLRRCWLANTDADCIVPRDWLTEQLRLANEGIEAVAGTISVDSFEEHGPQVPGRFQSTYLVAGDGSHSHVHGANLGIRADTYVRAGGWADLRTAEDHDLWRRLSLAGAAKYSTKLTEVITSGRRIGRAPHGFAEALAAHNESAA